MKALTVCQPYADLLLLPDDDPTCKRVENREWFTSYVGPLLIHAGKSRDWLSGDNYGLDVDEMVFGAIIGKVDMAGCTKIEVIRDPTDQRVRLGLKIDPAALRKWPWLADHEHAHGTYGLICLNPVRFKEPIPYRGQQGFFEVPAEVVEAQLELAKQSAKPAAT